MLYKLHRQAPIKLPLADAWKFFSDPRNLKLITPPWLNMQIASVPDCEMYPGMIISYKVHPILGLPLNWVTEITHVRSLEYFVDEQRYGPYRMWHHQHIFSEIAGGTLIEDIVDYILPLGILGRAAHGAFIGRQLQEIFDFREAWLTEQFGRTD